MKNLSLLEINQIFKNLKSIRVKKNLVQKVKANPDFEEEQGGSDTSYEVYRLDKYPDLYIKLTIETDSYGSNSYVDGIEFVKPTTKTIETYEII